MCQQDEVDLVFVLDASESVTQENFDILKQFTKDFLSVADIDGGHVRVGLNVYSSTTVVAFHLNTHNNKDDVIKAIDRLEYQHGGASDVTDALDSMRLDMFTPANGDRHNVSNVAMVITGGNSRGDPRSSANEARNEGIHIYAIGIGASSVTELKGIADKASDVFSIGSIQLTSGRGVLSLLDHDGQQTDLQTEVFGAACGKLL